MAKLVVLKLDGDFAAGFKVDLEIFSADNILQSRIPGKLPANLQLLTYLKSWQSEYAASSKGTRIKGKKVIFTRSSVKSSLNVFWDRLQQEFQEWLQAEDFKEVNLRLREHLNIQESIRVLLCANHQEVHQLPWSQWDFLQRYCNAGIAFNKLDFAAVSPTYPPSQQSQVKILAILGDDRNIDVAKDLDVLNSFQDAEIEQLVKPQREQLYDRLWTENWHIVFFAGHSKTIQQEGIIYLNDWDILTIDELSYAFERAIANGLQLAIFNSCDGLGLAYALSKLGLPQAIVMKEPVTDRVAHKFLSYFLTEYSSDKPLHIATRRARERLQAIETKHSFNSFLPVLYQNQSAKPLLWSELAAKEEKSESVDLRSNKKHNPISSLAIAIILACFLHTTGWLQTWELKSFDRAFSLRPPEARDERILIITVDDEDIQYQSRQGMRMRGSLSDDALQQLLTKLQPYSPVAIASDIVHDFAYQPELRSAIAKQNNFVAICRVQNRESDLNSIAPPPGIPTEQLGFTNMAIDSDGVIRRHLLGMTPDRKVCQSDISLSLRMALKYLDYVAAKNSDRVIYPRQFNKDGLLVIGKTTVPKIEFDSGAYRLPKTENRGYQTLLNYRSLSPQTISLRTIIEENDSQKLNNLIAEKIVFIGVKSNNNDSHSIPYSNGKQTAKIPGVLIHAQGTSQIISAVLDKRKLISWLPNYIEFLWIAVWSLMGQVVALAYGISFFKRKKILLFLIVCLILFILYFSYLSLFWFGYWLCLTASMFGFFCSLICGLFLQKNLNFSKK